MKIVSLAPSNTETLFFLGLGEEIIGVTEQCSYPEETKEKEKIGSFAHPDIKKIIALKPDLVVMAGRIHEKFQSEFRKYNIPLFDFAPKSVPEVLEGMEELGKVCGQGVLSRIWVNFLREKIAQARRSIPQGTNLPRVFRLMSREQIFTPATNSYQYDAICTAGGRPMTFDTQESYAKVTLGEVVKFDPEVIISCGRGKGEKPKPRCKGCNKEYPICQREIEEIYNWSGWEKISAVKKRRVYAFPCRIVCYPGPHVADLITKLAEIFMLTTKKRESIMGEGER